MFGFLGHPKESGHRFCQENLSAFLDGQLPVRDQERIRGHLEQCQACQWDLETLRQTVHLLHNLPPVKAPRSFRIPHTAPAPSVPFWMRPVAYGSLRMATAVAAALLVVTLAGNALTLPAGLTGLAVLPAAAPAIGMKAASEPAEAGGQAMDATSPAAASRTPSQETPSTRGQKTAPAAAAPTPEAPALGGGQLGASTPTLTHEEALRATAAPLGLGAGPAPTEAPMGLGAGPAPTEAQGAAANAALGPTAAAAEGATAALPAPLAYSGAPSPMPGQPAVREGVPEADGVAAAAAQPGQPAAPTGLAQLRQNLAGYPWRGWAIASAALVAVLGAATFWLRTVRARWPL